MEWKDRGRARAGRWTVEKEWRGGRVKASGMSGGGKVPVGGCFVSEHCGAPPNQPPICC